MNSAIFILSHGRSNHVTTYKTLKRQNYSGKIYIIVDDQDEELQNYKDKFENVIVFNKEEIGKTFDLMDNFSNNKGVVYARNASFGIAEKLGLDYFIVLDDDYSSFYRVYDHEGKYDRKKISDIDKVFNYMIEFMEESPLISSIAMAQGGDFIGGLNNGFLKNKIRIRKCMNSFVCSTKRKFKFVGRINEDANTYVKEGNRGKIFLTIPYLILNQERTQQGSGGLTDIYLDLGTYVKSFYTLMLQPSSVKIKLLNEKFKRLHHSVDSKRTYPKIMREEYKNNLV